MIVDKLKLIINILKGDINMVDLYVCLIVNNRRSFAQVPTKFQDAVRTDLTAIGLDENGNPVQTTQ
ncbi:hypothetical protein CLLU_09720 [Clostridium luticellarii]|uniref:Uncharacterized protein n=1 Tax=Clostridium luticellarii TaxID=1691940 RepID=A0A2T0BPY5_9CLOT|nr:hypothetical protein CLLU_09720 [Clostridium luticellarii]